MCTLAAGLAPAAASTTKKISTSATGGDCSSIGVWDASTKTCTLSADLVASAGNGIEIVNDNITLDGGGYSLTGSGGFTSGVTYSVRTGITVKNLTISQFRYGINSLSSSAGTITANTLANNVNGIYMTASNNNAVYNNNFVSNTTQAVVTGSGNAFTDVDRGGNFWSNYSTPVQGCNDDNGDFYCDAVYSFTGGQDPQAYTTQDGWDITHPPDTTPPEVTGVLPEGEIGTMSATVRVYYNDPGSNIKLATVYVYLDGSALSGCSVTQASASCEVYGLAMGPHMISGSLSDNKGNSSSFSSVFEVADHAAPSVNGFQPSGYINTGSTILSASYSDYLGSGIDSSTAAVYLDGNPVAGCMATVAGVSCPVSGLVDGNHTTLVYVTDVAGNRGSGSGSFQMDSMSPTIGAVQPFGSVTTGSATVSAYFSDSGSGINAASAVVYLDGASLSGCTTTAFDISCPVSNLAHGPHAISGSVADNSGNTGAINGSFTFVDTTAPSVNNILPTGTLSTGNTTLKANFSDGSGSGIDSSSVSVYLDGALVNGCTVTAANASCGVYSLANGSHTVLFGVNDKAGNQGTGTGTFTVDTSQPEVSATRYIKDNPTGGDCAAVGSWDQYSKTCALSTDLNFNKNGIVVVGNNITLDGNGHTLTGSGAFTSGISISVGNGNKLFNLKVKNFGYGVSLLAANGITVTDVTMQGNKYGIYSTNSSNNIIYRNNFVDNTISAARLSGGTGNMLDQPDPAGGNYWSGYDTPEEGCLDENGDDYCDAAFSVYGGQDNLPRTTKAIPPADVNPPKIYGQGPGNAIGSASATVYAYFSDPASGINTASAVVYLDGSMLDGCTATIGGISCPVAGLAEGTHDFTVNVSDNSGNSSSASGSFIVDLGAPVITGLVPTGYVNTASATVYAYYSDAGTGIDSASAAAYLDGTKLNGCTATSTRIICPNSGVAQGSHSLTVSVSDSVGNIGTAATTFTIDSVAPSVSSILPGGTIATRSATISAYYSDAGAGINSSTVSVYLDGARLTGCTISASSASCARTAMPDGTYTITAKVTDNAGNVGVGTGSFTVVSNEPLVTGILPSGNIATTSATIRGYYSDVDSGINVASAAVYLDGSKLSGCTATAAYISCPRTGLAQGAHNIQLSVSDNTNATGTGYGSFAVDSVGPVVSNIQPSGDIISRDATITAYYSDAASGVDSATAAVYLDGAKLAGCSASSSGISCPASGLALGIHNISVSVKDNLGNTGNGAGSVTVVASQGRPDLKIAASDVYWDSYQDYQQRRLTVSCSVTNTSLNNAYNVTITDSFSVAGISVISSMPVKVGDVAFDKSAKFTLKYQVPAGVSWWLASFSGTAENFGTVYAYS